MKKILTTCLTLCLTLCACKNTNIESNLATVKDLPIIYDEKFGGFFADISIEEFNAYGFEYGDSVDICLSNGEEILDVPYYNGYYTKDNEPLICAYQGYEHIKIVTNSGDDLYYSLNCDKDTKVTLTLNTKEKYLTIQNAMYAVYDNDRDLFDSDEQFANYRMMKGGDLKEGIMYRSCSPFDNEYNRADYADILIKRDGIKYIINLSDDKENIESNLNREDFNSPYAKSLYDNGKVILLSLGSSYGDKEYKESIARGLKAIINNEGPYLIHCLEGKFRTGVVAMLIEALCNATYEEMLNDYMQTYDDYYHINKNNKKESYDTIVDLKFNSMIFYVAGVESVEEVKNTDMQKKAKEYLMEGGITESELDKVIEILTCE